jgi:hypothetical protein
MGSEMTGLLMRMIMANEAMREKYNERAAKFEYDAGMTRQDAEKMALEAALAEIKAGLE